MVSLWLASQRCSLPRGLEIEPVEFKSARIERQDFLDRMIGRL
jgi:hypothetical protein